MCLMRINMEKKEAIKTFLRRIKISALKICKFIPDEKMVRIQYYLRTGNKLNLENPNRFTEKVQHYKLNYRNSLMHTCVDKYDVRSFVTEKGYENILIPLHKVFDTYQEFKDFSIPNNSIIKTTNASGTNIIIRDGSKVNRRTINRK